MSDYLDPKNEELLKDFFSEAQVQVETLEQNILVLENDPSNSDAVDEIFRAAHTLKGGAATVEMFEISEFTHQIEDLLDKIRSGKQKIDTTIIDCLLSSVDIIKNMLQKRSKGEVFVEDIEYVTSILSSYIQKRPVKTKSSTKKKKVGKKKKHISTESKELKDFEILELREIAGKKGTLLKVAVSFNENNVMNTVGGIQVYAALKGIGKILKTVPEFEELYEDNFFSTVIYYISTEENINNIKEICTIPDVTINVRITPIIEEKVSDKEDKGDITKSKQKKEILKEEKKERDTKPTTILGSILRVNSQRIDRLLNMVSEAVIIKATFNQMHNMFNENVVKLHNSLDQFKDVLKDLFDSLPDFFTEIKQDTDIKRIKKDIQEKYSHIFNTFSEFETDYKGIINNFKGTTQNLNRITGELQEGVMNIRMVSISNVFSRFPRLVRDLSRSLKKQVKLLIEGEETELDKSVIEDLLDPLIHCVRNSIDHGIEDPKDRIIAGKSPEGHILLKASNEGNMILIEVHDDGKGIDFDAIKRIAVENDIIHPNKNLSEIEAIDLLFRPGFSTAEKVTNVSGRGVGLDVVKKQIEKLNGSINVWSEKGMGTKFIIRLPLTLAIIQGLLVRVASETYAIPITSVNETIRIKPEEIKLIDNYEVFNIRDDVVSLLRLNRIFNLPVKEEEKQYLFVVIVGTGDKKIGLLVDNLIGEEDLVIKPLKEWHTKSPGIAGATILGDGRVSLIIDVGQLLNLGMKVEIEQRRTRD